MSIGNRATRQVDARITVIAILVVLALVQWVWWKGLVSRKTLDAHGPRDSSAGGPMMFTVTGQENVLVETLSGDPEPGDVDGSGRDARFDGPCGLALDKSGNLIVADSRNHRIRMIAPDGKTTTIAGSSAGHEDGPVARAQFNTPSGVDVGPDGAIYVADTGNGCIRKIKDGQVETVRSAGSGIVPVGISAAAGSPVPASAGPGLVSLTNGQQLLASNGGGKAALVGGPALDHLAVADGGGIEISRPLAVAPCPGGGFVVSDAKHCALFQIVGGSAKVLAGAAQKDKQVGGFRDGTGNRSAFGVISGLVSDGKGHIYVSDLSNNAIRKVTLPQ